MDDCVFCKILKKELPGKIVFENEHVFGLVPLDIISKGHVLVIPKQHYVNVLDVDTDILKEVIAVVQELGIQVMKENNATGINILNASGKDAQQSVFHLHFHVVPRYPNDGLDMWIRQGL